METPDSPEPDAAAPEHAAHEYGAGSTDPVPGPPAAAPERLRSWPAAIAIPLVSVVMFLIASAVMGAVAFLVVNGGIDASQLQSDGTLEMSGLQDVLASKIGFLLMVVAPQFVLVLPAVFAAFCSRVPTDQRLGLVRGHWPIWAWVAAAAATPLIGWFSSLIVGAFVQPSEHLQMTSEIFRQHGKGDFFWPLVFLIGATPAFCEELLFRGYVQTRLVRTTGPVFAIAWSSCLFAACHMDWVHAIAVLPLGLFLGFIAWRSGSLLPAMLAHFVNNAESVIAVVLAPEGRTDSLSPEMTGFLAAALVAGFVGLVFTVIACWKIPMPSGNIVSPPGNGEADPVPVAVS